jgi:hypothetical protein
MKPLLINILTSLNKLLQGESYVLDYHPNRIQIKLKTSDYEHPLIKDRSYKKVLSDFIKYQRNLAKFESLNEIITIEEEKINAKKRKKKPPKAVPDTV